MKRILWLVPIVMIAPLILVACTDSPRKCSTDEASVKVYYEDVDGTARAEYVKTSVINSNGGCEYRLEFNSAENPPDWAVGEVTGDQGDPQRYYDPECTCPSFTKMATHSAQHYEEQTVYFWIMKARQYAMDHLWVTPFGWNGGPITHSTKRVDPDVLDSGFGNACWPNPLSGCFRCWPHEGPRIHLRAGAVSPELVVHEFGHYAAGYVFGHMDTVDFWIPDCSKRAFQEAVAEMFMGLFFHDERYDYYLDEDPVANGVPRSSGTFRHKDTDIWDNKCGATDYVMPRPLVQAFHKTLWDEVWPSHVVANSAMAHAFSSALAKNRGHQIFKLASDILDNVNLSQEQAVSNRVTEIFEDHGFVKYSDVHVVELDFEPIGSDDYDLVCTGEDMRYEDVKLFRPIVRLDVPAPTGFELQFTIMAEGEWSDPNIGVFMVRFEAGEYQTFAVTTPNVKSVVEGLMSMTINRMPSGAPGEETRGFWLGCTKKCVVRGNGPKGNAGPQKVYLQLFPWVKPDVPHGMNLFGLQRSPSHLVTCIQ